MRIFIAVRTRFAEDALAAAVARGVRQLVVLGAGLDTYAYRGALAACLRVFEIDHAATQAWKRECLAGAAILTEEATFSTLNFIASLPAGAHVVFDYSDPPSTLSPEFGEWHERRAAIVAKLGEAWINYLDSAQLHPRLTGLGFVEIEDLGPREIVSRYFPGQVTAIPERGGHILRATTTKSLSKCSELTV